MDILKIFMLAGLGEIQGQCDDGNVYVLEKLNSFFSLVSEVVGTFAAPLLTNR